jgi:hypothetical protein
LVRRSSKPHGERHGQQAQEPEIVRFLEAAAALRMACCEPRIAASCQHAPALADLNQEIRKAIIKITGKEPEWLTRSNSAPVGPVEQPRRKDPSQGEA